MFVGARLCAMEARQSDTSILDMTYGYAMGPAKARRPTDTGQATSSLQRPTTFCRSVWRTYTATGSLILFFSKAARGGIPRGVASAGPAILSYGFRPFFALAGLWAMIAMIVWGLMLTTGITVGGAMPAPSWHAHEMVLGYTSAVLAGFMLTAVPNWTGRLPVSGVPLLGLVLAWVAGRLALLAPDVLGFGPSLVIDGIFLPLLTLIALREIVAGKNWKNLKIVAALATLSAANIWFLIAVWVGHDADMPMRVAMGTWVALIAVIGGRIIPSFTRNWMSRRKFQILPAAFGPLDQVSIVGLVVALIVWAVSPVASLTALALGTASVLNFIRLVRWRGHTAVSEPIVAVLHIAYLYLIGGLVMLALSAWGQIETTAGMHVLLVGAIGGMTLAVMTRASLGHTGRPITAGASAIMSYVFIFLAALVRPLVVLVPQHYTLVLSLSGLLWILAFAAFSADYVPILCSPRIQKSPRKQAS